MKPAEDFLDDNFHVDDWDKAFRLTIIECMKAYAEEAVKADRERIKQDLIYEAEGYECIRSFDLYFLPMPEMT